MALIATYTQQPADVLDYDIPVEVATGDAVSNALVVVSPSGLTVTEVISGNTVKLWVSDGAAGTTYKIEVTIETTLGRKKQVELKMRVKDY